ncbi:MAG TPA: hypothetical protein VKU01_30095 [Bryobacteraceae bacterium]|nr:hypothetical protein [Bryobacteraceae bacterium]
MPIKRSCRSVVLQVGIEKLQRIERHPGMARVGVRSPVIGYLVFRKALRTLVIGLVALFSDGYQIRVCNVRISPPGEDHFPKGC